MPERRRGLPEAPDRTGLPLRRPELVDDVHHVHQRLPSACSPTPISERATSFMNVTRPRGRHDHRITDAVQRHAEALALLGDQLAAF